MLWKRPAMILSVDEGINGDGGRAPNRYRAGISVPATVEVSAIHAMIFNLLRIVMPLEGIIIPCFT